MTRSDVVDAQTLFLVTALRTAMRQSPQAQKELWKGLALSAGEDRARSVETTFDSMMVLLAKHSRRPLATHDGNCMCIGADEAVFAQFIQLAADGEPEDAMLMGMLILRADIVPLAVGLAQQLGLMTRHLIQVRSVRPSSRASHVYH